MESGEGISENLEIISYNNAKTMNSTVIHLEESLQGYLLHNF